MKRKTLHSDRGFTLMEMLVVIAIIAVLITIVVGVSGLVLSRKSVEQTKVNMQVIRQAIDAYYNEEENNYPLDEDDFTGQPINGEMGSGNNPEGLRNWEAYKRGKKLYDQLIAVPQAQAYIANLDKDAIMNISGNDVFVDGFGKYVEYFSDGGVGAEPVIISAGRDGDFGTDEQPEYKADNIRSDGR